MLNVESDPQVQQRGEDEVYLFFEGGGAKMARYNLSWVMQARRIAMNKIVDMCQCWMIMLFVSTTVLADEGRLTLSNDSAMVWESKTGRVVRINEPQLTIKDPKDNVKRPFRVELKNHSLQGGEAKMEYALSFHENGSAINGTGVLDVSLPSSAGDEALIARMALSFREPVTADLETVYAFDVMGDPAGQAGLPERNGYFKVGPMAPDIGVAGRLELGNATKGSVQCPELGIPVVGLIFDDKTASGNEPALQLAVSADPYCGGCIQAEPRTNAGKSLTHVTVRTTYLGSVVPLRAEQRTVALEFHRKGTDGTLRSFYRTIPEIEPGAPWTHGIHLVYFDYLSEHGEGWFKDLKALADRIPLQQRGCVAVCMHGWYDYFQQYAYDHKSGKLLTEWTAFPGTRKIPMSLAEMHRRMKFAKDLGFRVLLYFGDGTNSDSGAPSFHKEYVLKDKDGKTSPGWKGPDSLGNPLMMDPGVPALREWYHGYLKALLDEYAKDLDGFVWDETFYIRPNFISYTQAEPAYADRAMMSLVSELTRLTQSYQKQNPDLVFLASDCGSTSYALVANGTFQDSGMQEGSWGPSMFANYRNCLWSCLWQPSNEARQKIAAEKFGLPQCLTNGWDENCGPNRMAPEYLDAVLKRFTQNVEANRQRLRYLTP